MNLEALRLFEDVARRLSFAAVAADRGTDPSSVSRAISTLEAELGLRLFQRTTRRMTLTEPGEVFFRRIVNILEELDQAQDEARTISKGPTGTLRLTASVAFGECLIVPLLADFRATYPDLKLELLLTDSQTDLVASGIDLAIRLGTRIKGDFICSKLLDTRYHVVASPAYLARHPTVTSPGDLSDHRCLLFTLPAFRSAWRFRSRDTLDIQEVSIGGDVSISSALSLRTAVLAGAGPALLADWLINDALACGAVVDVLPAYDVTATGFETAAWLLYPSRSYLPTKVRVTIDYLRRKLTS